MVDHTDEYEIVLIEKEWFSQYADYAKIKLHSHNGLKGLIQENKYLEVFCTPKHFEHVMSKKDFFDSKNTRELCRKGIPYFYVKDFVLKMFAAQNELEESFKLKFNKVFKDRDRTKLKDYVPYLTGYKTFKESVPVHYLNERGVQSVKEIQWMLNSVIPTMEHSPLLISINALLHLFCSQAQVYFILRNMINLNYSLKETYKIRWHMRFNFEDNKKVITSIIECLKDLSGNIGKCTIAHLEKIGLPPKVLVEDIVYNFFVGYLSFEGIIRLLPFYLREGTKSLYRMIYALFKTNGDKILEIKNPEEVIPWVKKLCYDIKDLNKLFDLAYSYNLTRNNNRYDFQPIPEGDEFSNRRSSYYLPNLNVLEKAERLLTEENLLDLWAELPVDLKIRDCYMIYSSSVHGFNLKTLYQIGQGIISKNLTTVHEHYTLFLLETKKGEVFGGIMSRLFGKTEGKLEKPQYSALVQFKPKFKFYEQVESKLDILSGDDTSFLFGLCENGAAIRLDEGLSHGYSNSCSTYNSPALTENEDGEYFISKFEAYRLG